MKKEPIFLEPLIVPRVWGGDRLATEFGRSLPDEPVGESWEIHGDLKISGQDKTLDQLVSELGAELLGAGADASTGFPLLTKWLDCSEWLSVQIHPDDALAREFTGDPSARGKTEAWYVHSAGPEAELIHGVASGATPEKIQNATGDDILPLLNRRTPRTGQLLFTPAGEVHALGPGSLIYEVQQSCDLTYRFYDWGRDRETHFERSVECMKRAERTPARVSEDSIVCRFFQFELLREPRAWSVGPESFQILACTADGVTLRWTGGSHRLKAGQSVLLPAGLGEVELQGDLSKPVIRVRIPEAA